MLDAIELGDAASGQLAKRPMCLALVHFLDFLRGLPEKQIGTDRGAEDGDHHQEIVGIDGGLRPDAASNAVLQGIFTVKAVAT